MARQPGVDKFPITTVKTAEKPLPERVADRMTELIIANSYRPGHKLPNEYILAERLGVGRSTVREAVKLLASRNVLEVRHGSGTYVSESTGLVDDPLGFRFYRDKHALAIDLCEIRILLEPPIAALAAENRTEIQVDEMRGLAQRVEDMYAAEIDHSEADVLLHKKIAEASGNIAAPGIAGMLSTAIPLFVDVSRRALRDETITTHRRIVEAIAKGSPRSAKTAMQDHIEHNRVNFLAQTMT
ncbi:MAG: FadR family transcriptional regulator [Planctomycetes bacterium]|nr:FadR family transcriptional regulator [Planctomycetota bacterium]